MRRHGVVLESARGAVPNLAGAIAGKAIRGSWWAHPLGRAIFRLTREVRERPDVLVSRLVDGKVTYSHRRVWAALARLAPALGPGALDAISEEHTSSGAHRVVTTPFPRWVPADVKKEAAGLSEDEARAALGPWIDAVARKGGGGRR